MEQAHEREREPTVEVEQTPNADIEISERFIEENVMVLEFLAESFYEAAMDTYGAIDFDLREALESLIQTHRTLQSGIYYEALPQNPIAASVCQSIRSDLAEFRKERTVRDAVVLGLLVFLQRIERDFNNGRKKGRAFISFLRRSTVDRADQAGPSLLIP